jgi:hypothetical protein
VFGGNLELKSLLQWLAASQAGWPYVLYFSFKNPQAKRLQVDWCRVANRQWNLHCNLHKFDECLHWHDWSLMSLHVTILNADYANPQWLKICHPWNCRRLLTGYCKSGGVWGSWGAFC